MYRQNRRIGGGKSLGNLGKFLLSVALMSSIIIGEGAIAGRKKSSNTSQSSKRSGSSQKSNSVSNKSSKRSGSSQKATSVSSTKRANVTQRVSARIKKISTPENNTENSSENTSKTACTYACPVCKSSASGAKNSFSKKDVESLPLCTNGFESESYGVSFGSVFKNKTFTFNEDNSYKLSDLINLNKIPDNASLNIRYSVCGMKLLTETELNEQKKHLAQGGSFMVGRSDFITYAFEQNDSNFTSYHVCRDIKRSSDITIKKSDLDKYYFYVDGGDPRMSATACPKGNNGIRGYFFYNGDDDKLIDEFDNWVEKNTKIVKDEDGEDVELSPNIDFSYVKFVK